MRSFLSVLGAMVVTLALLAGVVLGLGDSSVMVPPPESVAEGFARELETGRFARALPYLSTELEARVGEEELRAASEQLRARAGEVLDVKGEPVSQHGGSATARVTLKTRNNGEISFDLHLTREKGLWTIADLPFVAHRPLIRCVA